jgi:16S rRNA (guanine966-N2)-methyltransferase
MSIKILGGELKGLPLFVPPSDKTRPTSVLLKRRLFDANQWLAGKVFCDLCAGVGSIGLEALSRGAKELYAVENLHSTFSVLKKNSLLVQKRAEIGEIHLVKQSVLKWLPRIEALAKQNEVILFFDPPYENHDLYRQVMSFIFNHSSFKGEIWVESDKQKGPPADFWSSYFSWYKKSFQQGSRIIYIFSKY